MAHTSDVNALAFSPDGQLLASGSNDSTVILWGVTESNRMGDELAQSDTGLYSVSFAAADRELVVRRGDGRIERRDATTGALQSTSATDPMEGWISSSADGALLAVQREDGDIVVYDNLTGLPVGRPIPPPSGKPKTIEFDPKNETLATGGCASDEFNCTQGEIQLWDLRSGQPRGGPLAAHAGYVSALAFSPDGRVMASGGEGGEIWLWDTVKLAPIGEALRGHVDSIQTFTFSADGTQLASGDYSGKIMVWDLAKPERRGREFLGHSGPIGGLAFEPSGRTLASGSADYRVMLVASGQPIGRALVGHTKMVRSVEFSSNGARLVSVGDDGRIFMWDTSIDSWRLRACGIAQRNLTWAEWQKYLAPSGASYRATCPDIPLDPAQRMEQANALALAGDSAGSAAVLTELVSSTASSSDIWLQNLICWHGSLDGHAAIVLGACQRAVDLDPENPQVRDSRGLARALTDDLSGAAADFQYFVDRAREHPEMDRSEVHRREEWIVALNSGRNPIDDASLMALRVEGDGG